MRPIQLTKFILLFVLFVRFRTRQGAERTFQRRQYLQALLSRGCVEQLTFDRGRVARLVKVFAMVNSGVESQSVFACAKVAVAPTQVLTSRLADSIRLEQHTKTRPCRLLTCACPQ